MKKWVSRLAAMLIAVTSIFSLAACGDGKKTDKNKSQIYVGVFNAGIGYTWLEELAERFETAYANTSFEDGKTGVQVFIDPQATYSGISLSDSMSTNKNSVIFAEQVYYDSMVKKGQFLDITDVVTSEAASGEGSIESKLSDYQKKFMRVDDKYYALPYYQVFTGLVYDIDLFERNLLYLSDNGGFISSLDDTKSAGPDGEYGTDDDGFPATYDELYEWIDDVRDTKGVIPLIFAGKYKTYTSRIFRSVAEAYNGKEGMSVQATFDSGDKELEVVMGFETNNEPVIGKVKINQDNGYYARQLLGNYYGMKVTEYFLSNEGNYTSSSKQGISSQVEAQEEYIYSSLDAKQKSIALIAEGNYWENEARNAFKRSEEDCGDAAKNRRYGFFPMPTSEGSTPTLTDTACAFGFINSNIANDKVKVDLARTFLKFCYNNDNLSAFTACTGVSMGLNYDLKTDDYNSLTSFQKSVWERRKKYGYSEVVSNNSIYLKSQTKFTMMANSEYYVVSIDGGTYKNMWSAMKENGKTAEQYFKAMWISESDWNSIYKV